MIDVNSADGNHQDGTTLRFPSFDRLRETHLSLHRQFENLDSSKISDPEFWSQAVKFVQEGVKLGAMLDSEADRASAQSMLDYWANRLARANKKAPDSTLADFNPELAPELADKDCPYKGLDAFDERDYRLFFGRENAVNGMLTSLKKDRFLGVIGLSGSGKSSLVMAGLLPALKSDPESKDWHCLPIMVPGSNPLKNLAKILRPEEIDLAEWDAQCHAERLAEDDSYLAKLLARWPEPVLLVIDQFEELFTLCFDRELRAHFASNLLHVIRGPKDAVVLTIRSDFLDCMAQLPEFQAAFGMVKYLVPPFSRGELQDAILKPANQIGLKFKDGVVQRLLDDIIGERAGLPLLQFTLRELWEKRERNRITLASYSNLGGVRRALENAIESFYNQLTPEKKYIAKRIFLKLVHLDETGEPTRERVRLEMLYKVGGMKGPIDELLERLSERTLGRFTRGETPADTQFEVTHEALVRNWRRLRGWLSEEENIIGRRDDIKRKAREWESHDRDSALLLRGSILEEALQIQYLDEGAVQFVKASQDAIALEEEKRRERDHQVMLSSMQASLLAARSQIIHDESPPLSILLAIEAINATKQISESPVPAAEEALQLALVKTGGIGLSGHSGRIRAVTISSDNRWVVSAGEDTVVRIWDLKDPDSCVSELKYHNTPINTVALSSDGRWLATGSEDSVALLWDFGDLAKPPIDLGRQEGRVRVMVISADSRWLVIGSEGGTPRLWDLTGINNCREPRLLRGHSLGIRSMSISADNHWLVTGSDDHTARLWDLRCLEADSRRLEGHGDAVSSVTISPNNRWLITACLDKKARVWDLNAADPGTDPKAVLSGHEKGISSAIVSPNSRWLITTSWDDTVRLWDLTLDDPNETQIVLEEHNTRISELQGWPSTVAVSPDNRWLVTAVGDKTVHLRDLDNPKAKPFVLYGHEDVIRAAAISNDSHWLVTVGDDKIVRLWDLTSPTFLPHIFSAVRNLVVISADSHWLATTSGNNIYLSDLTTEGMTAQHHVLLRHQSALTKLAISSNGQWLAAVGEDRVVRLWDITAADPAATGWTLTEYQYEVTALVFSPDNRWLASAAEDWHMHLCDLTSIGGDHMCSRLEGHAWAIRAVAISSDSNWLVSGGDDSIARLWDMGNLQAGFKSFPGHQQGICSVAISHDNRWLATGSKDKTVRLWDITSGDSASSRCFTLTGYEADVTSVLFSHDNRWLVTKGDWCKVACLWDLTAADPSKPRHVLEGHEHPITAMVVSPDNHWLVTGSVDTTARLWDLTSDSPATNSRVLTGHRFGVRAVAISSDNHWLVTGSDDSSARMWDLTHLSAPPVVFSKGHEHAINTTLFSPDSHWLITATATHARLWDLQLDELVKLAGRVAGRNFTLDEWYQYFPQTDYRKTCPTLPAPQGYVEGKT